MSSPWNPSPFVKFSLLTHAAAGAGLLVIPGSWPWALAAVAANQGVLIGAGLLPRTTLLGPNINRLPDAAASRREIALTIDDGPDPEVTPHVLDLLDAANAKASFFCIGHVARRHPALCREIVARGHRVENHGDSHSSLFATFGSRRMAADITAAQVSLSDLTGQAPRFFRPTAGLRSPLLDPVLARLGLRLASWTRRPFDTREGRPDIVHQRLSKNLAAGDILLMHDGHAALTPSGQPVILEVLPRLLQTLTDQRLTPITLASALP
jgi:peptidoglycan/xylan/chitin deacetylase (PgdA/CDA1 family)